MFLGQNKVLTPKGFQRVEELYRENPDHLCVSKLGLAPTASYTLKPLHSSKSLKTWTFRAPRPCCVPLIDQTFTYDLRRGDVIPALDSDCGYDASGWGSGFMFRHGLQSSATLIPDKYPLHSGKLQAILDTGTQFSSPVGVPQEFASAKEKGSFARGFLAADGAGSPLRTGNKVFYDWFLDNALYAGIIVHGSPTDTRRFIKAQGTTIFYDQYQINWVYGSEFSGFKVVDVSDEECATSYSVKSEDKEFLVVDGGWKVFCD